MSLTTGGRFPASVGLGALAIVALLSVPALALAPAAGLAGQEDGGSCHPLWKPVGGLGLDGDVHALAVYDDGTGPALFVGGFFTAAGNLSASHIARWDGTSWSALGSGVDGPVQTMVVFDDGGGPALHVGGGFEVAGGVAAKRIARWRDLAWDEVGPHAFVPFVRHLLVSDHWSGTRLYAAWANFPWISQRSGTGNWEIVGEYSTTQFNGPVHALAVFDDGTGPALYAGGGFTFANVPNANRIVRIRLSAIPWWEAFTVLGSGLDSPVHALAVFDDGQGSQLYAGGKFTTAGGQPASRIARWNGSSWSSVGGGVDGAVFALTVYDDGAGPALYAAGAFQTAGGVSSKRIARWDGQSWSALGDGLGGPVFALAPFAVNGSPSLHAAGAFTQAGALTARRLARWDECGSPGIEYCPGDGSMGVSCPCANAGRAQAGCGNSTGQGGKLAAEGSGSVAADDLRLVATGFPPGQPALLFVGLHEVAGGAGEPFGAGLRCVSGGIVRLDVLLPDAQGSAEWGPGLAAAVGWLPGHLRRFQVWYRDHAMAFPGCASFNLSNGVAVPFH